MTFALSLSPHGALVLCRSEDAPPLPPKRGALLESAFGRGAGHGLLRLGADEPETPLPGVLSYWREFGARYVSALCAIPGVGEDGVRQPSLPTDDELDRMVASAPPMLGAEYLTRDVLADLWRDMSEAFDAELSESGLSVQEFLKSRHPAWNLVGRVYFNLAENRKDDEAGHS